MTDYDLKGLLGGINGIGTGVGSTNIIIL